MAKSKLSPKASKAGIKRFHETFAKSHGDLATEQPYDVISTGIMDLDLALVAGGVLEGRLTEIWGVDGMGKGHPLGHPVLTPTGWRPVGDLSVGDQVIGGDGGAVRVVGVFDRGRLPVYRVEFTDGGSVECDGDHLWLVEGSKGWVVRDTQDLASRKLVRSNGYAYRVPIVGPVDHPERDLPIEPYLMGVLLANGHLKNTPRVSTNDDFVMDRIEGSGEKMTDATYAKSTAKGKSIHGLQERLRELGLFGLLSGQKFIPDAYLFAGEQQRRDLLAGLMDCDGSTCSAPNKSPMYYSTSLALAEGVQCLVRSLGGVARLASYSREHPDGRPYVMHNVTVKMPSNPFLTPKKAGPWHPPGYLSRKITSIERVEDQEVRCISVDAPDSLYVTKDHVVTHNTSLAMRICGEAQKKHPDKVVAWIDMEHTFDFAWARLQGMSTDEADLWVVRPRSAEGVADAMKDMLQSGYFSMVVVDSIGAMIPEVEKAKDADEATMAVQAKIVTRMVKIAAVEASVNSTGVLLLNQVRANLSYGADTTTGGGFALKHVTTHKIKLSSAGGTPYTVRMPGYDKPVVVGFDVAALVERNKVGPSRRRAGYTFFHTPTDKYGPVGVDSADDATSVGIKTKVIEQAGAFYTLPSGKRLRGREAVIEALREDPAERERIRTLALATVSGELVDSKPVPEEGEDGGLAALKGKFSTLADGTD